MRYLTYRKISLITDSQYKKLFAQSRRNASLRPIEFALTNEQFWFLVNISAGRCQLTGLEFSDEVQNNKVSRRPFFPSIDRIDSRGIYEWNNVRLVCACVNMALNVFGDAVFTKMCLSMARQIGKGETSFYHAPPPIDKEMRKGLKVRGATHKYYQALIWHNGKRYSLGVSNDPVTAQMRYLEAKALIKEGKDFSHLHDGTKG